MARFDVHGFAALERDFDGAALSQEEQYKILEAGSVPLISAMRAKLAALGLGLTGRLSASIKGSKKVNGAQHYMVVAPAGTHHSYRARRSKAAKTAHATEVGYVLEYGSPKRHIKASHWMQQSVEEAGGDVGDAMQGALDEILDSRSSAGTE